MSSKVTVLSFKSRDQNGSVPMHFNVSNFVELVVLSAYEVAMNNALNIATDEYNLIVIMAPFILFCFPLIPTVFSGILILAT